MASKRYLFDTECDVFPDGVKIRGMVTIFSIDGDELRFPWSAWKDTIKDAFNEAYDLYIHGMAEAITKREKQQSVGYKRDDNYCECIPGNKDWNQECPVHGKKN